MDNKADRVNFKTGRRKLKDDDKKKVLNIIKHYDNIEHAERFFRCGTPSNISDRIRDKEFQTVFSNLDFNALPSKKTIAMDIGVGGGRYIMYLVNRDIRAVGIDTGINPLKYASKRIDARFIRASVTDLPFKEETFDLIICIELLHHFSDAVLERVLTQISRVTKAEGIFVFDLKNEFNLPLWYRYKKRDTAEFPKKVRTIHKMEKLVKTAGFEIIKKKGIFFPITLFAPFVVVFARKGRT